MFRNPTGGLHLKGSKQKDGVGNMDVFVAFWERQPRTREREREPSECVERLTLQTRHEKQKS